MSEDRVAQLVRRADAAALREEIDAHLIHIGTIIARGRAIERLRARRGKRRLIGRRSGELLGWLMQDATELVNMITEGPRDDAA